MAGRPKQHPDTTKAHPNRLSPKAIDLLRRVVEAKSEIHVDNEKPQIVRAVLERGLVTTDDAEDFFLKITDAGRALIEKLDSQNDK